MSNDKERKRREKLMNAKMNQIHAQNVKDFIQKSGVETTYEDDLQKRRAFGSKIENWLILITLVSTILIALTSCSTGDGEFCVEDCTLISYTPTYMTCNTEEQTFTYRIDTTYTWMYDNCECNRNLRLLEESFWDIVETYPDDQQFMFYEVPVRYKCVKN